MDLVSWIHVVLDGSVSGAAAIFWARALHGTWRAAGPDADLAASLVPVDGDTYVHRAARGGAAPALVLEVDDVGASTRRLLALGATASTGTETETKTDELRSPGGLTFRLIAAHERRRSPATRWPDGTTSRLVQVCLDCPAAGAQAEAEFWRAATGWTWRDIDSPEFVCHLVPTTGSVQLLVQRRASTLPRAVTLHLDLGASDPASEAARLTALGATWVATGDGWIVLSDPDGRPFCASPQPPEAP